jgi:hypothetical protein
MSLLGKKYPKNFTNLSIDKICGMWYNGKFGPRGRGPPGHWGGLIATPEQHPEHKADSNAGPESRTDSKNTNPVQDTPHDSNAATIDSQTKSQSNQERANDFKHTNHSPFSIL